MMMMYLQAGGGRSTLNQLSVLNRDASDLLTPVAADTSKALSDDAGGSRRWRRRRPRIDCSGDRDSVSSLPSTLAAYIHEEHEHSGGTDRCLTLSGADRQS